MGAGQMRGHCMSPNAMLAMKWGDTSRCVGLLRKGTEYREVNTSSERRLTHASGCHKKGKCFKCTIVSNCHPTQHNSLRHGPHIFRNLLNLQIRTHEGLQELQLKLATLASESHQKEELFLDMRKSNAPCNRKWSWGKCPGEFVMGVLASSYGYLKQNTLKYYYGIETSVLWREVVPISEGPLSKVPLYVANKRWNAPAHEECSFKHHCRTAQGHVVLLELESTDPALRTTAHACHLV